MEGILIQWIVNGGLIAVWPGDCHLGKSNDFIWRYCVGSPIPVRVTEFISGLNPGIPINCISRGNLFSVRLYNLLVNDLNTGNTLTLLREGTHFI